LHNKNVDIKFSFESNKTKVPKQENQNRLRSAMPEGYKQRKQYRTIKNHLL